MAIELLIPASIVPQNVQNNKLDPILRFVFYKKSLLYELGYLKRASDDLNLFACYRQLWNSIL